MKRGHVRARGRVLRLRWYARRVVRLVFVAIVGCVGCGGGGGGDDALQAGECRTKSDCAQSFDFCATYTLEPLCHGMAESDFSHPCQLDGECAQFGASSICDNRLCIEPRGGAQPILHCQQAVP